jgi:hypothetical protein
MSIADIVNTWHRERLAGGPLARATEAYNQVIAALPELIARLDPSAANAVRQPSARPAKGAPEPDQPA